MKYFSRPWFIIILLYIFNCSWVDTRSQQHSTQLHTNSTQNTQNGTYITIKRRKKFGKCGPCPVFASYALAFTSQLRKKHGKPSVRLVEKCPDIPVAVVQYTFTHIKYVEQHNESNTQNRTYITIRITQSKQSHYRS
jgi:hypothetical protein